MTLKQPSINLINDLTAGVRCSEKVLIETKKKLPLRHDATMLIALVKSLVNIFKQATINPFYKVDLSDYSFEYRTYFRLATHFFTLIYQSNRVMENKAYVTTREDVIAALQLLEAVGLKQERKQVSEAGEVYEFAKNKFGYTPFTAKELQYAIGFAKTSTHRFLHLLLEREVVKRTGYNNRGYRYQLVERKE